MILASMHFAILVGEWKEKSEVINKEKAKSKQRIWPAGVIRPGNLKLEIFQGPGHISRHTKIKEICGVMCLKFVIC